MTDFFKSSNFKIALLKFCLFFVGILAADQAIKAVFLDGFHFDGEFISLILTFNKGVAFSMFAFLGENLKFIQIVIILGLLAYLFYEKKLFLNHAVEFGILAGAGFSNIIDRFIHGGVVDYVFWHKWFEFAVFNFADVMIDFAVVILIIRMMFDKNLKGKK